MGVREELLYAAVEQAKSEAEELRIRVSMLERERFKLRLLSASLTILAVICFWIATA